MNKEQRRLFREAMAEIGAKGGSQNTPAQMAARRKPKKGAGRPRKIK